MTSEKFADIFAKIKNYGIIPIIKIKEVEEAERATPVLAALAAGGLNIAEITLETDGPICAAESVRKILSAVPGMLLAAGNVSTEEQVKAAVYSGAKLIMSLGFDEEIAAYCDKSNIMLIIECSAADEIAKALGAGIDVIKYSPAESNGGIEAIRALSEQYPQVKFIAEGGINGDNILDYLSLKSVIACGGSYMIDDKSAQNGDYAKIKESTLRAVRKMLGFDLAHIVMNCESSEQAENYSSKIESIFGFEKTDAGNSITTAGILHFMKTKTYGKNGQIAISSNFVERAVFYLEQAGKYFINESARFNDAGDLTSIYLDSIIGGFAIKLVPKA